MRYVLSLLFASSLYAQPAERAVPRPNELVMIARYEARLNLLAQAVRRDAFIVSQVVQGVGELNDFQKNIALQKAIDRVNAASKRANDDPKASPVTMTALSQTLDALEHGRDQGASADLPSLQRVMLTKTHDIYIDLFRGLDAARKERQALVDVQTRLATINQDIDAALIDALSSSFEFIRAGGK